MKDLKIAIAGLGVAGSLLSSLIEDRFDVDIYEVKPAGFYPPCGWAVNENEFRKIGEETGIDSEKYVMRRSRKVTFINSRKKLTFPAAGLCTIDKLRLLSDLSSGRHVNSGKLNPADYDLVFDCTGVSRYYIGPAREDFVIPAVEIVTEQESDDFTFRYFKHGGGYEWFFPLNRGTHHGVGTDSRYEISRLVTTRNGRKIVGRNIRLKPLFESSINGNVIAVGESAGTVSPLTGEGIIPSMQCAMIAESILSKDAEFRKEYLELLRKHFHRYERLFNLLIMARNSELLRVGNISYIKDVVDDFRSFGIGISALGVIRAIA